MSSAFKSSVSPSTKTAASAVRNSEVSAAATPAVIEVVATIAYPSLTAPDPKSGDKYAALFLVEDPDSQQALKDLVSAACEQTFRKSNLPAGAHNPLRDASERTPSGEFAFKHPAFRKEGAMVFRAKTGFQPECVEGENETPTEPSEIHGGDQVVVQVSAYGYSNQSSGVALSLNRVWLVAKGTTRIERGAGGTANVRRIDRSRLRFSDEVTSEEA